MKTTREDLLALVAQERAGAVASHGDIREGRDWLMALAEEFGEVARAINEIHAASENPNLDEDYRQRILMVFMTNLQQEAIQVAAVALGIAEQAAGWIDYALTDRAGGPTSDV